MTTIPLSEISVQVENQARFSTHIAVIIPVYNEASQIASVLESVPGFVQTIIVVDDQSQDNSAKVIQAVAEKDPRIVPVYHESNGGVGKAMLSGFQKALEIDADIVVKMDGDGQMDPEAILTLIQPLLEGKADYTKGNRFRDFQKLRSMPLLRRFGNSMLSFLTKGAVGYWNIFDPCNGFVAIRKEALCQLPINSIDDSFFFETSMLAELYLLNAVVKDVPLPARYGDEVSHLSIMKVLRQFPIRLAKCFFKRIFLKNFVFDFNMGSVFLVLGTPLMLLGIIFGSVNWWRYALKGVAAPTGTVVILALLITVAFQLLLSAISEDLRNVPEEPLSSSPLLFNHQTKTSADPSRKPR